MSLSDFTKEELEEELELRQLMNQIPEGWALMRAADLVAGKHEVYDPSDPSFPWKGSAVLEELPAGSSVLVVARRRKDQ